MENPTFTALAKLGLLSVGTPLPSARTTPTGEHAHRDHTQFCRFEYHHFCHPFPDRSIPLFETFEPDTRLDEALRRTNLVVLLGAEHSEVMQRCMETPDAVILVFEPDETALAEFLAAAKISRLAQQRVFLFLGDPYSFTPALQDILPRKMFLQGTPVFFQTPRIAAHYDDWARQTLEYIEILHFRHAVYPLTGQTMKHSHPIRTIKRKRTFAQQFHAYENIGDYLVSQDIGQLGGRLEGRDAILVAAGPALTDKLDYLRRNRGKAVIFAVNNALKPLAEAGIKPHFAVINDTSLASGEVFRFLPPLPGTIMVGHCLAALGGDVFKQKYLFESYREDIFPERPDLDLQGSVITAAFSLARLMGCARCIFVGAQLASHDPWKLSYAKGATNHSPDAPERPLINQSPQLYPVDSISGERLYTTPNFRDAALWLAEEIRLSGIPCINTAPDSIIKGTGVTYESEPAMTGVPSLALPAELFRTEPPRIPLGPVREFLAGERAKWTALKGIAGEILDDDPVAMVVKGEAILKQLDESGVTYMVEGYPDFNNRFFHDRAFADIPDERFKGFQHFFTCLEAMCSELLDTLGKADQACREPRP